MLSEQSRAARTRVEAPCVSPFQSTTRSFDSAGRFASKSASFAQEDSCKLRISSPWSVST